MERQRVVHFAKTRTARVIRPGSTKRPICSQTVSSDPSHAPLASIDSDFVVITKRRDETNMAPDLWEHIRKSVPQASFYLQADSGVFDQEDSYTEQDDYIPPRTYVKLRSTQNLDEYTDYNVPGEDRKIYSIGVRQHRPQSSTNPDNSHSSTLHAYKSLSTCTQETSKRQTEPSCMHKVSLETGGSKHQAEWSTMKKQIEECAKPTATVKTSAQIESTPTTVFLKLPFQYCSIPTRISENGFQDPSSCFKSSPDTKIGHVSHTGCFNNYLEPFDINAQINHTENDNVHKSGLESSRLVNVSNQKQSSRDTKKYDISRMEHERSVLLPEMLLPFKCIEDDDDPLPEMYSMSPSAYSSSIRLTSERLSRTFTNYRHSNHRHLHRVNQSKEYSSYLDVSTKPNVCFPVHDITNNLDNDPVQHTSSTQTPIYKDNINMRTSGGHVSSYVEHQREPTEENNILPPESMFSWKRHSLKLATHGYLSISELEDSLDCLASHTHNLTIADSHTSFSRSVDIGEDVCSGNVLENTYLNGQVSAVDRNGTSSTQGMFMNVTQSNHLAERINSTYTTEFNMFHQHKNLQVAGGFKRLPLKLATPDVADVWLLETDPRDPSDTSNNGRVSTSRKGNGITDKAYQHHDMKHRAENRSLNGQRKDNCVTSSTHDKSLSLDRHGQEEKLRKFKRRSFILATRSLSDLTLLDDSVECENLFPEQHPDTHDETDLMDFSNQSANSSSFHTPESRVRRLQNGSVSSSRLNSSFGSFYSCRSLDLPKVHHAKYISVVSDQAQHKQTKAKIGSPLPYGHKTFRHSIDSNSSRSDSSSVYCTASEKSFLISDVSSNNSPCISNITQRPSGPSLPGQWRRSHDSHNQKQLQIRVDQQVGSRKSNTLPHRSPATRNSNPITMFQCYGCGVDDRLSFPKQHRRGKNNSRRVLNRSRVYVNPDYIRGQLPEDRKRSRSVPTTRLVQIRHVGTATKHVFPIHTQNGKAPNVSPNDISSSNRSKGSTNAGSVTVDSSWQAMPRLPPSLGRPRRKLYAGFDSQPLPMDSFLSDSSSVYSTQSCSSWSTSRSATTESISRTSDIPSRARSASSIASSAITPTNHVTQDEVFDFFTYTNKRSSTCENNHNFYLGSEKSGVEDCFKDSFYDKAYSKESLESILSEGTTVSLQNFFGTENCLDYVKPRLNSAPDSTDFFNGGPIIENGKETKDKYHHNRLNNSHGSEPGLRLGNNNKVTSASLETSKNQLTTLKAVSSAQLPKSNFLSKRKYFSCKDILDLVMTSEKNYKHSKGRSKSLERQAQKMCEVILCLN